MNYTEGNFFWNEKIGVIKKYPYLSNYKKCDVLIIGGGIAGAITAFVQAKEAGVKTVVVDKNIIGYASTLENNGVINTRVDFDLRKGKNLDEKTINTCIELSKEAINSLEDIIQEISKDDEIKTYIKLLNNQRVDLLVYSDKIMAKLSMYKLFEKIAKANENIEYLEKDPLLNLRTGIIFKDSAYIFNPYILTQLIFLYLSKMDNVEIYENTNITNINAKEDMVTSYTNNRFKIESKNVILTNGIQIMKYISEDKISLNKTYTIVTEKIQNLDENMINISCKSTMDNSYNLSFTKDKRIIFTGEDIKQNEKLIEKENLEFVAKGKYKKLLYELKRVVNTEEEIKPFKCFSGIYMETKDGLPIIDELNNMPNVYCNLSNGKNGVIFALIGAKMLKDITKRSHIKDMYLFRENREI